MNHKNSFKTILITFSLLVVLSFGCSDHCADCSQDQTICFACEPGYQISVLGKCFAQTTAPKCILYSPMSTCFVCQPTFSLKDQKCEKDFSACLNTNLGDGNCFECGFGTLLQEGKCRGTINCDLSEQNCTKCVSGLNLKDGKCYPDEGCNNFDQTLGVCKECSAQFDLVGYRCIKSSVRVYDCYIYNQDNQCQNCKNGYILFQSQCLLPIDIALLQDGVKTMFELIEEKKTKYGVISTNVIVQQQVVKLVLNCQVSSPKDTSQCLICVYGFYPSSNGKKQCLQVSELCDGHDVSNGNCYACKNILTLKDGKCIDLNCLTYQDSTCRQCKDKFSFNLNNVCAFSDPNCQIKDFTKCFQCSKGYKLNNQGFCQVYIQVLKIDKCKVVDQVNKICALCQDRFYRSNNQCLSVSQICKDYEMTSGKCKSCVQGYSFSNGQCSQQKKIELIQQHSANQQQNQPIANQPSNGGGAIIIPTNNNQGSQGSNTQNTGSSSSQSSSETFQQSSDQNCLKFQSRKCIQCSNKFYVSPVDGKCIPVNPLCQNSNTLGQCTSCYKGYNISGNLCVPAQDKDPYCKQVVESSSNLSCKLCFDGYFVNSTSKCQPFNPLCKSTDFKTGKCTACYQGYTLAQGVCKVFVKDPNCQQYGSSNNCLKCSLKFYLNQGVCKQVSPLCRESDSKSGQCTVCYPGYSLSSGACVVATAQTQDVNCEKRQNNECKSCYHGYYLNSQSKKCIIQNLLCKSLDKSNGNCLTCYDGYVEQNGNCDVASGQTKDLNCKQFNPINNKKCLQCYKGYFVVTLSGICTEIDSLCQKSDQTTGKCFNCYNGYNLVDNKCVITNQIVTQNTDPYCTKINLSECLQCNKGYFLASNNVCTQVDILCKTYSLQNGQCTTCFQGYVLSNGKCIVGQELYIPFCQRVSSLGKCLQCIDRYYVDKQQCKSVSILCQTFNKFTGKCNTCIGGYVLQGQECIYPALGFDSACSFYNNSYCTQCKVGYFLDNYFCAEIDRNCLQFDYQKGVCTKCFNSTQQGAYCV